MPSRDTTIPEREEVDTLFVGLLKQTAIRCRPEDRRLFDGPTGFSCYREV